MNLVKLFTGLSPDFQRSAGILLLCMFLSVQSRGQESVTPDGNKVAGHSLVETLKRTTPDRIESDLYAILPELPCLRPGEEVISHTGFSLSYNATHRQANWVAYELTCAETTNIAGRSNRFIPDPQVKSCSSSNEDYKGSGYDRGHLAPAADMGFSMETMTESFYLSNMSPQKPGFNRGIWKNLEALVRGWACNDSALLIVTGGILQEGLPAIGKNKVSVPRYFFKAIVVLHHGTPKGIAFVIPNEGSGKPLAQFATSIDDLEAYAGIDLFCGLDDETEAKIEGEFTLSQWNISPQSLQDDTE